MFNLLFLFKSSFNSRLLGIYSVVLCLFMFLNLIGIGGLDDTRLICGTIVAEKKDKQEKEGKVREYKQCQFKYLFH